MKTVREVSRLTGVSVRTLHYYDEIGLLCPDSISEAGYRLYGAPALERLQNILLFRELEFSLKDIRQILDRPDFDRQKALDQQIQLLRLKKERLDQLIDFALGIQKLGVKPLNYQAFDKKTLESYKAEAKKSWGTTEAFREYEQKTQDCTEEDWKIMNTKFMSNFAEFGRLKEKDPSSEPVQSQVKALKQSITDHYYTCTDEILASLGEMYTADDRMKESLDCAGGQGTAQFTAEAIRIYCQSDSK
ncbi:MerR family transcriptional regulator [Anaerostipes sp.]|uniref:MerR family transcriptional regulator n=1 Tax=Anaerostipes sp. TaxID=1872530 RepID=UPI0025BBF57E|nr:MerR family transcriptional regulator [Anaerostipes sp.]MBS7007903.1 MerR family transcriptional regulator [Anaerostipes sp.]